MKPGGSFVVLPLSLVHVKAPRLLLESFDCSLECASLLCLSALPGNCRMCLWARVCNSAHCGTWAKNWLTFLLNSEPQLHVQRQHRTRMSRNASWKCLESRPVPVRNRILVRLMTNIVLDGDNKLTYPVIYFCEGSWVLCLFAYDLCWWWWTD